MLGGVGGPWVAIARLSANTHYAKWADSCELE